MEALIKKLQKIKCYYKLVLVEIYTMQMAVFKLFDLKLPKVYLIHGLSLRKASDQIVALNQKFIEFDAIQ